MTDTAPEPGGYTLTPREVITLLYLLDELGDDTAVAQTFSTTAAVKITPERARQIRSKMMSRLRGAAGRGEYAPALREALGRKFPRLVDGPGCTPLAALPRNPVPLAPEDNRCRIMETRTCPPAGPCGDRPCARFESDDPTPWAPQGFRPCDDCTTPFTCESGEDRCP